MYDVVLDFTATSFSFLRVEGVVDAQDVGSESVNSCDDREILVCAYSVLDQRSSILVNIGVRDNKAASLGINGYVRYDLRLPVTWRPY